MKKVYKCDTCGRQGIAEYQFYETPPLPPGWQQSVITVQRDRHTQETHVEYWCRQCGHAGVVAAEPKKSYWSIKDKGRGEI